MVFCSLLFVDLYINMFLILCLPLYAACIYVSWSVYIRLYTMSKFSIFHPYCYLHWCFVPDIILGSTLLIIHMYVVIRVQFILLEYKLEFLSCLPLFLLTADYWLDTLIVQLGQGWAKALPKAITGCTLNHHHNSWSIHQ